VHFYEPLSSPPPCCAVEGRPALAPAHDARGRYGEPPNLASYQMGCACRRRPELPSLGDRGTLRVVVGRSSGGMAACLAACQARPWLPR
jgi:hypothetical protein